jgi:hypothetical protein
MSAMQWRILLLCAGALISARAQSVNDRIPRTLEPLEGAGTIADYSLARLFANGPRVAPASKLLAVFDLGGEGKRIITGWTDQRAAYQWTHHFQVFRFSGNGPPVRLGEFTLGDGPTFNVRLYRPTDARDRPKIVFDIAGGATWGSTYLLDASGSTVTKLFAPNSYNFADLNGDGVYEAIAWDRRPNDARCKFGVFAFHVNPQIYVRSGATFRKAWPSESSKSKHVMALLADIDGDGAVEIVSLTDDLRDAPGAQRIVIYRYAKGAFTPLAETTLPWPKIAFLLSGIRQINGAPAVIVRLATQARCEEGGNPEPGSGITEAAWTFRAGRLHRVALQ